MDINTIKAKLQMLGNRIIELNVKNDFVHLDLNSENLRREINISHDISELYFLEDNLLARNLAMDVDLKISDISEESALELCIGLRIEGGFCIEEGGTDEELVELLNVSGAAALYSIARGIVASVTSQTCTNGTVLLPMINMFEVKNQKDQERGNC